MNKIISPPLLFRLATLLVVILILAGLGFSAVLAANPYEIFWYTFDGGGATSTGGTYTVMGTLGQPDAGLHSGSGYNLTGGFWAWVQEALGIYLPLIRKP